MTTLKSQGIFLPACIRDGKNVPEHLSRCAHCKVKITDDNGDTTAYWFVDGYRCNNCKNKHKL